ncbi:integrase core domain-containing protein [Bacillus thuringiensis]|uniref:integrase core domain-containing protein n=1 Tax=Bacillus thuringiensis TaxID=1428 RepID=UPI003A0FD35A
MNCSMSRKGNCYDNACIESFHGVLKKKLIYQQQYVTRAQAQQDIWDTLRFSIILKEFIQRMTIYHPYKKKVRTNWRLYN